MVTQPTHYCIDNTEQVWKTGWGGHTADLLLHYSNNTEQVGVGTQQTHYCTDNTEQVEVGTQLTHYYTDNTVQLNVGTQLTHS